MNLIYFILICLSITNIICKEFIFEKFRNFIDKYFKYSLVNKMLKCLTCTGFWVGVLIALVYKDLGVGWFEGGLISSIINKIVNLFLYKF